MVILGIIGPTSEALVGKKKMGLCGVERVHDCEWVHKVWAYAEASKGQKEFAVLHLCLFLLRQNL